MPGNVTGHYPGGRKPLLATYEEILNMPIDAKPGASGALVSDLGVLEFDDVTFTHRNRRRRSALADVGFRASSAATPSRRLRWSVGLRQDGIALLKLLVGLYQPKQGRQAAATTSTAGIARPRQAPRANSGS